VFVARASIITAAIPFSAMLYGMARTAFNYTIKRKTLTFPNLPQAFDGVKVVQISDMHSGSFASVDNIRRAFDLISGPEAGHHPLHRRHGEQQGR
jgi:predicted MPP superfamily phosphohydrolase